MQPLPVPLWAMSVVTDPNLVLQQRVERDRHPFIEYGPEDEGWRVGLGFVTPEVPDPNVYIIGGTIVGHPAVLEQAINAAAGGR